MLKAVSKKSPDEQFNKARDTFIEAAGKISANMLGMVTKVGGQIYALLFLSSKPLSLDEITEQLQTSKSNVSINIRLLEECKLVKKVWVKGSRKDYYEAVRGLPKQVFKDFFDRLKTGVDESIRIINKCKGMFEEVLEKDKSETQEVEFVLNQLLLLTTFYEASSKVLEHFYQGKNVNVEVIREVMFED